MLPRDLDGLMARSRLVHQTIEIGSRLAGRQSGHGTLQVKAYHISYALSSTPNNPEQLKKRLGVDLRQFHHQGLVGFGEMETR